MGAKSRVIPLIFAARNVGILHFEARLVLCCLYGEMYLRYLKSIVLLGALCAVFDLLGCSAGNNHVIPLASANRPAMAGCQMPQSSGIHVMMMCQQCADGTYADTCSYGGDPGGMSPGGGSGTGQQCTPVMSHLRRTASTCITSGSVAAHPGLPADGVGCSGSPETVGDTIPSTGGFTSVADINAIWQGSLEVGWMYLGTNGNRYFQGNFADTSVVAISIGIYKSLGFSITQPSGYGPVVPWSGMLPPGSSLVPCFTKGKILA